MGQSMSMLLTYPPQTNFDFFCKWVSEVYTPLMHSLPFVPRKVKATERVLDAIYGAAFLGLKDEALALAADLLPDEFLQLANFDPMVTLTVQKGRADSEIAHAKKLSTASLQGDIKASLAILQHQHGWSAKQDININVTNISITAALAEARGRIIDAEHSLLTG